MYVFSHCASASSASKNQTITSPHLLKTTVSPTSKTLLTNQRQKTKKPSQTAFNELIPNELNIFYPHAFKFDARPKEILYKTTKKEVKLCTCGEFDCLEQDSIQYLFENENRPSFLEYQTFLKNPKVRTSSKTSVVEALRSDQFITVNVIAKNTHNATKKFGGDFWIVRLIAYKKDDVINRLPPLLQRRHVKQIVVPPSHAMDHKNGRYSFKFSILPETYTKTLDFKLQVYLERSAEMIEVNRRAMSSYHIAQWVKT